MSEVREVSEKLAAEIGLEMTNRGIETVRLEYTGSGDSQDAFDVYTEEKKDGVTDSVLLMDTNPIIEKLEEMVEAEHGGYENEAGGRGWMVVSVIDGTVKVNWEHSDLYQDPEPDDDDAVLDQNCVESIAEIIKPVARSCIITYVGGGDSMDGYNYAFMDSNGKTVSVNDRELINKLTNELDDMMCNGPVSGFWNNEGGHGEIFIDSQDLDASYWNHANYCEASDTSLHEFEVALP